MIAPTRFHFYQHTLPRSDVGLQEQFERVELEFRDGRYRAPNWVAYDVIPQAVQLARFDCALDASAPGAQSQLVLTQRCCMDQETGAAGWVM